jgi:hypothetical protein
LARLPTIPLLIATIAGNVFGNDDNVGGLIGHAVDTDVNGCSFAGDVNGNENVGGLIGQAQFATLLNKKVQKFICLRYRLR